MWKSKAIIMIFVFIVLLVGGCQTNSVVVPTRTLSPENILLKNINDWEIDELDALECPADHPNYRISGETTSNNEMAKKELQDLGLKVRCLHMRRYNFIL